MKKKTEEPKTKEIKITKDHKAYYVGTGRRREAVAQVRLTTGGSGEIIVNEKPVEKYFTANLAKQIYLEPFRATDTMDRFTVTVKVRGSGQKGQLIAMVHGISRALLVVDNDKYRTILRRKGFLTRDPRTRERRKVGHGGKARREKQSPKR